MQTISREYQEREQAFWAGQIQGFERSLDAAYRSARTTGNTERVEALTAQLQRARIQHSAATDALMALDGLAWDAGKHRWVTI